MDTETIITTLKELVYLFSVFGFFLAYVLIRGRQAVINLIFGLYLALLISIEFPYYDAALASAGGPHGVAIAKIIIFAVFTLLATILIARVMPDAFREKKFESFFKKILLALAATILIMVYSFLTPGTPIQSLFAPAHLFFWWLLAPFVMLWLN
jgi:hypothetical protein